MYLLKNQSTEVQILSASSQGDMGSEGRKGVVVDVVGAVKNPGLYTLASDSRVNDAIAAAGGFTEDVDRAKVNLAAKISDGQKIMVPAKSESGGGGDMGNQGSGGLVDINTASQLELESLPGIGPATASKIVSLRPYSSLDELLSKKAITKSVYGKIKDLVTF